jgi:hypothetical protein
MYLSVESDLTGSLATLLGRAYIVTVGCSALRLEVMVGKWDYRP